MILVFRPVSSWIQVTVSTPDISFDLGLHDVEELTKLRDELSSAVESAEHFLKRMRPEEKKD